MTAGEVLDQVLTDLRAVGDRLADTVAGLDEAGWRTPTPAEGWDVATQVAHLAWTDEVATLAARAHEGDSATAAWDAVVLQALGDPDGFVDQQALEGGGARRDALLERWSAGRVALAVALRELPPGERMPWFGPPMSAASMATARLMETWAHSLDVHDALGVAAEPDHTVRHVAHLGVRTRDFAFGVHGLEPPTQEFRVELVAPSGETWAWGPADAAQSVRGPAYDFGLLVTQRRHRADLALVADGPDADRWLDIAQAFAGPPGTGREPREADG